MFYYILDELFKVHKLKPTPQWRQRFDNYIKTMPGYYAQVWQMKLADLSMIILKNRRCIFST